MLVTCLCLTRDRREWLPQAIRAFLGQTYLHRELLIVADGEDVRDLLPDDRSIRLVCAGSRLSIGAKRNYGCALARGEIIAHWDDDDYSRPGRLSDQVGRLLGSGLAVTGYHSMPFLDPDGTWWLYQNEPLRALGTSLCYQKSWWQDHPFPDMQIGEDGAFSTAAFKAKQLVTAPGEGLMWATNHAKNTCPREKDCNWRRMPAV